MNQPVSEQQFPIQSRWIIKDAISLIFLSAPFIIGLTIGLARESVTLTLSLIFIGIGAYLAFIVFLVTCVVIRKRHYHYLLDQKYLVVEQGVFSKQKRFVPYGTIQNLFIKRDILDRVFSLSLLTIENAASLNASNIQTKQISRVEFMGSSNNMVSIPGLNPTDAQALKTKILEKMAENPLDETQSAL